MSRRGIETNASHSRVKGKKSGAFDPEGETRAMMLPLSARTRNARRSAGTGGSGDGAACRPPFLAGAACPSAEGGLKALTQGGGISFAGVGVTPILRESKLPQNSGVGPAGNLGGEKHVQKGAERAVRILACVETQENHRDDSDHLPLWERTCSLGLLIHDLQSICLLPQNCPPLCALGSSLINLKF